MKRRMLDVGVETTQIELVDDGGDRTHLVIRGHLGVEVDPPPGDLAALRALDPHVALRLHRATPAVPGPLRSVQRRPGSSAPRQRRSVRAACQHKIGAVKRWQGSSGRLPQFAGNYNASCGAYGTMKRLALVLALAHGTAGCAHQQLTNTQVVVGLAAVAGLTLLILYATPCNDFPTCSRSQ